MTILATHCEAKKHAYRQTQDGIVVSFVLHPQEVPDDLALAALGTRYMLALVRIGDDEEPQEPQKPQRPKERKSRSQQAGILCNDPAFQLWASQSKYGNTSESGGDIRGFVLNCCKINSRRELDVSDSAAALWDDLRKRFEIATGRRAP